MEPIRKIVGKLQENRRKCRENQLIIWPKEKNSEIEIIHKQNTHTHKNGHQWPILLNSAKIGRICKQMKKKPVVFSSPRPANHLSECKDLFKFMWTNEERVGIAGKIAEIAENCSYQFPPP